MLVATKSDDVGAAVIDWYTPLNFGVGATAGVLGVSPLIATAAFLLMSTAKLAMTEGAREAFFSQGPGQSHMNELADLLVKYAGYLVGVKARALVTGQPALSGKIVGFTERAPGQIMPGHLSAASRALLQTPVTVALR